MSKMKDRISTFPYTFIHSERIYFKDDPDQNIHRISNIKYDDEYPEKTVYKVQKDWYMDYQLGSVTKESHPEEYL